MVFYVLGLKIGSFFFTSLVSDTCVQVAWITAFCLLVLGIEGWLEVSCLFLGS